MAQLDIYLERKSISERKREYEAWKGKRKADYEDRKTQRKAEYEARNTARKKAREKREEERFQATCARWAAWNKNTAGKEDEKEQRARRPGVSRKRLVL